MKNTNKKIINITLAVFLAIWTVLPYPQLVLAEEGPLPTESAEQELADELSAEDIETEVEEEPADEVDVDTGDAVVLIDVENKVNTNETEVIIDPADAEQEEEVDESEGLVCDLEINDESGCEELDECNDEGQDCGIEADSQAENEDTGDDSINTSEVVDEDSIEITNDNEADVDNDILGVGNSGDNIVDDNETDINISTGEVQLISNIFNLINFNIIGTDYINAAYNLVGSIVGDLDLSRYSLEELAEEIDTTPEFVEFKEMVAENEDTGDGSVNESSVIDKDSLEITNDNIADVDNNIILNANSGLNEAIGNDGNVKLVTGNISVASNLVNIVNTNIVGNGWTLAIINIVGEWVGDLVLPSLTNLIKNQTTDFSIGCYEMSGCMNELESTNANTGDDSINRSNATSIDETVILNNNQAEVENNIDIIANSGGNDVAENNGSVDVETGEVNTLSQTYNQLNTNIIGGGWVFGIVNVLGNWFGNFYGQPDEGFSTEQTGNYWTFGYNPYELLGLSDNSEQLDSLSASNEDTGEDSDNTAEVLDINSTKITNNNQASVENNVTILANSGSNLVVGNNGNVNMQTGGINAMSNVMNMINTNMIGDNWTFAIINVLGDWEGDVNFGKPDLFLNEIAVPDPEPAIPGGYIDYYLTVTNKGDAPAHDVELKAHVDEELVQVVDTEDGTLEDGVVLWLVDKIDIGEILVKHYRAKIHDSSDAGEEVKNHAEVWSVENDRNPEDNVADTKVVINSSGLQINGWGFPVSGIGTTNDKTDKYDNSVYTNPVYNQSISVNKTNDTTGVVYRNQTVNYSILLQNKSDKSFYDVIVFDDLYAPDGSIANTQNWSLGEVLPGEGIRINYSINISAEALAGEYVNKVTVDGFDDIGRYSIFPYAENSIEVSDLDGAVIGQYVDIGYHSQTNKYVGEDYEQTVVITNLAADDMPVGKLVLTYSGEEISINGDNSGGAVFDVPALESGKSGTVQFKMSAGKVLTGALLNIYYNSLGNTVASLTASHDFINPTDAVEDSPSEEYLESIGVISDSESEITEEPEDRDPRILGYTKSINDIFPPLSQSAKDYYISSVLENMNAWWFILLLLLTIILFEIYRQQQKGNKFVKKTFGFRIF